MKLIIQIPCYNEDATLWSVLSEIPKKIAGIDIIETQIIDDGSSDNTIKIAKKYKVTHILQHAHNQWLWNAFNTGVKNALLHSADILVNTDWDNQYPSKYIKALVQPIIKNKADIVIWDRETKHIQHFSPIKKFFQWLWSSVVRLASGTDIPDSVSWFRAYSAESLLQLNVTSTFSYAVDTLIQAGKKKIPITHVKITTNPPTRPSRLFKNMFHHMFKTSQIIFRIYTMYNPLKIFSRLWALFAILGSLWVIRFLYFFYLNPENTGKVQSLILSWVLIIVAIQFFALGVLWDLIWKNRRLIEDNLYLNKKKYYKKK